MYSFVILAIFTQQGFMSMDGFSQFMLGPENDIINVDRCSIIYQDMTQPLSHYYIASSHNTYLLEDQLKGPSSCEAYVRALRKGCRCVECKLWVCGVCKVTSLAPLKFIINDAACNLYM